MTIQKGRTQRIAVAQTQVSPSPDVPNHLTASPLYGVAMLKIAMELKKADARPLDELITGVLKRMNLSESTFREFLAANGGLLKSIAEKRGF